MSSYTIVVIDDVREPVPFEAGDTQVYRTCEAGLDALKAVHARDGHVDELWLDHDMGMDEETGEERTIMPVVEWLEEMGHAGTPLDVRYIFVHTANYLRGDVMIVALQRWYRHVMRGDLPCV